MPISWSLGWAKGFVGGAPLQRSNFVFFKSCFEYLIHPWMAVQVAKEEREELIEMVSEIYRKHDFEFMHVSKRIENVPPVGWDRGRSSIHILRSLFGVDWEEMVQVCLDLMFLLLRRLKVKYWSGYICWRFCRWWTGNGSIARSRIFLQGLLAFALCHLSELYLTAGDQRRRLGDDKNLGQRPITGTGRCANNAQVIR